MKNYLNTIIIAVAVILFAFIVGAAYKYKFKNEDKLAVTGLAEKDFTSDLIVWSAYFSRNGYELKSAYAALKQDENDIRKYLNGKGINNSSIVFTAININKNFTNRFGGKGEIVGQDFSGYTLTQTVTIESKDIAKVETISREITELIQQGIELNSSQPSYYYTKLADLKIDLLADASKDAKNRAETIAKNAGSTLGDLKNATMGVFQITGKNSNEDYSYGGAFNTSSKVKTASITLKTEYAVK